MSEDLIEKRPHCATFSDVALEQILGVLDRRLPVGLDAQRPTTILDPFAGVGTIHKLSGRQVNLLHGPLVTYGIELEAEWAIQHPSTMQGDALELGDLFAEQPMDAIVTSPAFGNRMADSYDGRGRCKACSGIGFMAPATEPGDEPIALAQMVCERCKGSGLDRSKRATYRISLGRELSEGSGASMQWGEAYRDFHRLFLERCHSFLGKGQPLIIDMKDHYRRGWQDVPQWWAGAMAFAGFRFIQVDPYEVDSMSYGANGDLRASHAFLISGLA